jgi:hypothetical protein
LPREGRRVEKAFRPLAFEGRGSHLGRAWNDRDSVERRIYGYPMIPTILKKIFGSRNERLIKKYSHTVRAINAWSRRSSA